MSDIYISEEEELLLNNLAAALGGEKSPGHLTPKKEMLEAVKNLAKKHAVLSLIYEHLAEAGCEYGDFCREIKEHTTSVVLQNYRRLLLAKYTIGLLEEAGIACSLLKGASTAAFYPVPEYRKSGDVDILLKEPKSLEAACALMEKAGFSPEATDVALHYESIHQKVYITPENIAIELHTMLTEPFDDDRVNRYIGETLSQREDYIIKVDLWGIRLPVLAGYMHGFELLVHMLQHFLATGFGLRLLCDWTVFWNREVAAEQQALYLSLLKDTGLRTFSNAITAICIKHLGLKEEYVSWMGIDKGIEISELLREILDAGEFGVSGGGRMVALRGDGITDYIREFHHQMRNNYPKASRLVLLWPLLWSMNLAGFLYNNRTLGRAPVRDILKNAGERGRLVKKLKIFVK